MNQGESRPTMLNAEQVAQRLNMSKGFAYKIIQEMNEEQIKKAARWSRAASALIISKQDSLPVMKMPVYRSKNGTFYSQCFYRDGRGAKCHKVKRGFTTELEALMWEKNFLVVHNGTMDMLFADFVDVYVTEIKPRIREHTWLTKEYMIKDKNIPFFGMMRMSEIKPIDVVRRQNQLIDHKDLNGKPYSTTYLRTINNQLNAIFNHVERYYDLTGSPCRKVTKVARRKAAK